MNLLTKVLKPGAVKDSLNFDCIYQLKYLVKSFYQKKNQQMHVMMQKLDQLIVERPNIIEKKKKHFFSSYEMKDLESKSHGKIRNVHLELQKMRMLAEQDKLLQYKGINESECVKYYNACKRIHQNHLDKSRVSAFMIGKLSL